MSPFLNPGAGIRIGIGWGPGMQTEGDCLEAGAPKRTPDMDSRPCSTRNFDFFDT